MFLEIHLTCALFAGIMSIIDYWFYCTLPELRDKSVALSHKDDGNVFNIIRTSFDGEITDDEAYAERVLVLLRCHTILNIVFPYIYMVGILRNSRLIDRIRNG